MVEVENKVLNLKSLNLDELTGVINSYPWYGAARMELCKRMAAMGGRDWGVKEYSDAAMYIVSRNMVSDIIRSANKNDYSDKDVEKLLKSCIASEATPVEKERKEQVVVKTRIAGGDFFSPEQYDGVKKIEDDAFGRFAAVRSDEEEKVWEDSELGFCTETLAGIYAEQGYFVEAKKIYSRLILRYPEKSAYFASLIEKLQQQEN